MVYQAEKKIRNKMPLTDSESTECEREEWLLISSIFISQKSKGGIRTYHLLLTIQNMNQLKLGQAQVLG